VLRLWAEVSLLPEGPKLLLEGPLGELEAFTVEDDAGQAIERAWREVVGLGPPPAPAPSRARARPRPTSPRW
jgi:hypothetical protein